MYKLPFHLELKPIFDGVAFLRENVSLRAAGGRELRRDGRGPRDGRARPADARPGRGRTEARRR